MDRLSDDEACCLMEACVDLRKHEVDGQVVQYDIVCLLSHVCRRFRDLRIRLDQSENFIF